MRAPALQGAPRASPAGSGLPASRGGGARRCAVRIQAQQETSAWETVELGKSGIQVSPLGVGAWSWGDSYWSYGNKYGESDVRAAFDAMLDANITFLDTAEVYGLGKSEALCGEFAKARAASSGAGARAPVVCTKFAPLPGRFTSSSVVDALKASLARLQADKVGLYIQHWPGFLLNGWANDAYLDGLAACKRQGLCDAVGVSNFTAARLREAHRRLADEGVVLSSNQVQYSLLYRTPEANGVAEACRELGVTLVAYSPLCQGLLTGKFSADSLPGGPRRLFVNPSRLAEIEPLLGLVREIGQGRGGKTPAQVALNWAMAKGTVPIPGAKNARQVAEIAGALGWALSADEVAALDDASGRVKSGVAAPFENW